MVDSLTPSQRSERMSRIRSADTKPELALRSALHRLGLRFRLHAKEMSGKPDIVLPRYRAVIFVHGCFWHRHEACKVATTPKSNTQFWVEKFDRNKARDVLSVAALERAGWRVHIAWECELDTPARALAKAVELAQAIRLGNTSAC
ncbi:DNA mismatch endonuclease Vsr [Sphingomonas sp. LY160]|uniref:very short patch repair endonuclease n=1 Tax=Sphingomonas sp. LY160 TaxID=3095342 RepID=UPI002ADEDB89|nr:DNA mismatch endonuclease Vsr [Sphingomonas sp. LY160]MEA1071748.1 DNA mismatch endonuclease Vsr [Sphingomonas sp. LY160]